MRPKDIRRLYASLFSLFIMMFFILMFPPVKYKSIGLMYGYTFFDSGEILYNQIIFEIAAAIIISGIIYLAYPAFNKFKNKFKL